MLKLTEVKNPHIHIFGAGGTGGFALEYLSRLFANSDQRVTIEIYDGDEVEAKNLKRQNFIVDDITINKSDALIKRLTQNIEEPPTYISHTEYITDSDELMANIMMTTEDDETVIMVSAVDNVATRRLINQTISDLAGSVDVIALDSGNDNQGGQVVLYSNSPVENVDIMGNSVIDSLPTMLQLYPEIDIIVDDRDENPGIVTHCAEEAESKPQAMMANVRNGELLASIIYQVTQNEKIPYNVWTSSILTGSTVGELRL